MEHTESQVDRDDDCGVDGRGGETMDLELELELEFELELGSD